MSTIFQMSFDSIIGSLIVREVMILALPDRIAGPGGWLINTKQD